MSAYLIRRFFQSLIVIFGVTLFSFFSLHLAGDPTLLYVNERASNEEIQNTRHKLGFDRPLYEQYIDFLVRMGHGDFGKSLVTKTPALDLIKDRLPATIELHSVLDDYRYAAVHPDRTCSPPRNGVPPTTAGS